MLQRLTPRSAIRCRSVAFVAYECANLARIRSIFRGRWRSLAPNDLKWKGQTTSNMSVFSEIKQHSSLNITQKFQNSKRNCRELGFQHPLVGCRDPLTLPWVDARTCNSKFTPPGNGLITDIVVIDGNAKSRMLAHLELLKIHLYVFVHCIIYVVSQIKEMLSEEDVIQKRDTGMPVTSVHTMLWGTCTPQWLLYQ